MAPQLTAANDVKRIRVNSSRARSTRTAAETAGTSSDPKTTYLGSSTKMRIQMRKKEAKVVEWSDENKYYQQEFLRFMKKIRQDKELAGYVYSPTSAENLGWCHMILGQKIWESKKQKIEEKINEPTSKKPKKGKKTKSKKMSKKQGKKQTKKSKPKKPVAKPPRDIPLSELTQFIGYHDVYTAPKSRILITENITFDENDVIPVYSDIQGETVNSIKIPEEFVFHYNDENRVNARKEKDLHSALTMAEKPENHIKCDCHDTEDGALVPCYLNPNCPCSRMNKLLRDDFQNATEEGQRTELTSLNPILLKNYKNTVFDVVGFGCSELCGCQGKCTNNPLLLHQKKVFPIEMYRSNADMGFNIRSPVLIPAGTPFITFSGDVVRAENFKKGSDDYCFKAWQHDEVRMSKLLRECNLLPFDDDYRKLLSGMFLEDFYVDPLVYGNIGRTAGHTCAPNVQIMRVWRKSLSPAHITLVMVALQDIFPGTPIAWDYGGAYADKIPTCMCNTFACKSSKHAKKFDNISYQTWAHCVHHLHDLKMKEYEKNVIDPLLNRNRNKN